METSADHAGPHHDEGCFAGRKELGLKELGSDANDSDANDGFCFSILFTP